MNPDVLAEGAAGRDVVRMAHSQVVATVVLLLEPTGRQCFEKKPCQERLFSRGPDDRREVDRGEPEFVDLRLYRCGQRCDRMQKTHEARSPSIEQISVRGNG